MLTFTFSGGIDNHEQFVTSFETYYTCNISLNRVYEKECTLFYKDHTQTHTHTHMDAVYTDNFTYS